jgi:hypothetical protein
MMNKQRKGAVRDQAWAVVLCQSFRRRKVAQRQFKQHLYRAKVAAEMVQTERSYMRALGVASSVYRTAAAKHLQAHDVKVIFGNIERLRSLNIPFWKDLENRTRAWSVDTCIGDIFTGQLKPVLNEYIVYVKGYDNGLKLHDKLLLRYFHNRSAGFFHFNLFTQNTYSPQTAKRQKIMHVQWMNVRSRKWLKDLRLEPF